MNNPDLYLSLIAIFFPPVTVWIKRGICSADSLINICLCTLGGIPGILHAWYIIHKYPDGRFDNSDYFGDSRNTWTSSQPESRRIIVRYVDVERAIGPVQQERESSAVPHNGYGSITPTVPSGQPSSITSLNSQTPHNHQNPPRSARYTPKPRQPPPPYEEALGTGHKIQTDN